MHPQQGGSGNAGGGTALWSRYLGGHPLHGQGPGGGGSYPGGETADGTAPAEYTVQEVEIHLGGGSKG